MDIKTDDFFYLIGKTKKTSSLQLTLNYFTRKLTRQIYIDGKNISIQADLIKKQVIYYEGNKKTKEICLESISCGIKRSGKNYLLVIKNLEPSGTESGTKWLQGIVDHLTSEILTIIPSFSPGKDSEQE